ncbi:hypothetical protein BDR26DRAFT_938640 [Obelidium mucronatum]|nr:hypothetical protein BDR26DRAFT_938640 [Obelidium mucronatum]
MLSSDSDGSEDDEIEYGAACNDAYSLYQRQLRLAVANAPLFEAEEAEGKAEETETDSDGSDSDANSLSPHFRCPISMRSMKDPVVAADGVSYEHERIKEWLAMSRKSPTTNLVLKSSLLTPNINLRNVMQHVKARRNLDRKRKLESLNNNDKGHTIDKDNELKSENGIFVYRVLVDSVELRLAPTMDFGLIAPNESPLKKNQIVCADLRVSLSRGIVFVRLEHTHCWIFEMSPDGQRVLEDVDLVHPITPWIFRNESSRAIKLRKWPDYRKDCILSPALPVIEANIEFRQDQGHLLSSIPNNIRASSLRKRLSKFTRHGLILNKICVASDGAWCAIAGAGSPGIPNHAWCGGNLEPEIISLIQNKPISIVCFSKRKGDFAGVSRPYVIIHTDGTVHANSIRPSLMSALSANATAVVKLCLVENGEYFVSFGDKWAWEFNDWELCRTLEKASLEGTLISVSVSPQPNSGVWIVICRDGFIASDGVDSQLTQYLTEFYSQFSAYRNERIQFVDGFNECCNSGEQTVQTNE